MQYLSLLQRYSPLKNLSFSDFLKCFLSVFARNFEFVIIVIVITVVVVVVFVVVVVVVAAWSLLLLLLLSFPKISLRSELEVYY